MLRRSLALATALLLAVAAPVAAGEYDGTSGGATVSGETITVTGEGFEPNAEVDYSVDYTPAGDESAAAALEASGVLFARTPAALPTEIVETGTATANANGEVTFPIQNRGPGTYEIVMTDGVNTAVATVTVAGDTSGGPTEEAAPAEPTQTDSNDLALTGSDGSVPMAQIAAGLIVFGGVAVYVAKRRRNIAFRD